MKILLDIDGVMVTTPSWRTPRLHSDGFLEFNPLAARNLSFILDRMHADVVLTTTHRINYTVDVWQNLLRNRGIRPHRIFKINDSSSLEEMPLRSVEIMEWVHLQTGGDPFVVLDDDRSLYSLPARVLDHCVITMPLIGLDDAAMRKALLILEGQ